MAADFLNRGRSVPTVVMSAPSGTGAPSAPVQGGPSAGLVSDVKGQLSDAMQGRVSLILLNSLILGMIGFYLWTHNAQGGG